jgi:hypothetical protein
MQDRTVQTLIQAVAGAWRPLFRRTVSAIDRTIAALVPIMAAKIIASPMAWGKPRTLCGPTVMIAVAFADSIVRSVMVTVAR